MYRIFLKEINEYVPENKSLRDYMFDLYESSKYSFLMAIINRPDIPPRTWRELRKKVFETYGEICLKCLSTDNICVDHIKPYSIFPELCIEFNNLQPMCRSCNSSKGNKHFIDYRNHNTTIVNS
jgi:hypothetical protein